MKNKSLSQIIIYYYLPLFAWMGLIFYLSSLPGEGREYPPDLYFYVTRKGAHIAEYFFLTILFIRILKLYKIEKIKLYIYSAVFSLTYAFSDEVHQLFVFGRDGKFLDIGVDLIGILLAIISFSIFIKEVKNNKK